MKQWQKWLILIALLVAALVCYRVGFSSGVIAVLVIGTLFELAFWIGLLSNHAPQPNSHEQPPSPQQ